MGLMKMRFALVCLVMAGSLVGCGDDDGVMDASTAPEDAGETRDTGPEDDTGTENDTGTADSGDDAGMTTAAAPGSACNCDSDCQGDDTHPPICVAGVCMTRASATCASAGSSDECPDHQRCWNLGESDPVAICWPDVDTYECAGSADSDGSCVPNDSTSCDGTCSDFCGGGDDGCPPNSHRMGDGCVCDDGFVVNDDRTACVRECTMPSDCGDGLTCIDNQCVIPPCTPGSCGDGSTCDVDSGVCIVDIGTVPPGPPPACAAGMGEVPDWRCTADCAELVPFEPDVGPGYWDYPINGETEANEYRSYIRRDVMMLIKYASAMVACQAADWAFGNGGNLGLGDMSEADGAIPGTSVGSPGHPPGTHVDGHDMDIAYYQTGTTDNRLRAICEHRVGGADQYHCTGPATLLDPWRTALFLGHMHANPNLRIIGVDGQAGPPILSAVTQLCNDDWLETSACSSPKLTYEVTDMGRGWFRFHHHHFHISVSGS